MYSQLSLKPSELSMKSIENEQIAGNQPESFSTEQYVYFTPNHLDRGLYRVPRSLYREELTTQLSAMEEMVEHITEVITLNEIYSILLLYEEDERVQRYLRSVENDELEVAVQQFTIDCGQNCIAVTLELEHEEYCIFVKNISSPVSRSTVEVLFNVRPKAVFSKDSQYIYCIQRAEEGGYRELIARRVDSLSKSTPW